ncbi:MAG: hypothetical protein WD176_08690, partial [Pirellulales bacterium]
NDDGIADGSTITRDDGSFNYRAAGLVPSATAQTIHAWVIETAYDGQPVAGAAVESYTFILTAAVGGTTNTPDITEFKLVEDTLTPNDRMSSNTTVTGLVGDNIAGEPALVEIDLDGIADANNEFHGDVRVTPAASGRFTYRPDNTHLPLGTARTLRARSVAWDAETEQEVFGEWETLTITRLEDDAPTIVGFDLLHNDTPLTDPTVKGTVENDGRTAGLRVEFDIDIGDGPDGTPDGFAFTNEDGYFEFTPYGLTASQEITIYARVVEWDGDEQAYVPGNFNDYYFSFELDDDGPAEPEFNEEVQQQIDVAAQVEHAFIDAVGSILAAVGFGGGAGTASFLIGTYPILSRGGSSPAEGDVSNIAGPTFDTHSTGFSEEINETISGTVENLVTPMGYVHSADYTTYVIGYQEDEIVSLSVSFSLSNIQYEQHTLLEPTLTDGGLTEQRSINLNITGDYGFNVLVDAELSAGSGPSYEIFGAYVLRDHASYEYDHTEVILREDPEVENDVPTTTVLASAGSSSLADGVTPNNGWGEFYAGEITNQPYHYEETIHIETLVDESGTEVTESPGRDQTRTFDNYEHSIYHEDRVDSGYVSTIDGQSVAVGTLTVDAWATLEIDDHETVSFLNGFVGGSYEQGDRTTTETASYNGTLTGSADYVTGQSAAGEFEFADSLHAAFHEIGSGSASRDDDNSEDWNYDVAGTLSSSSAADGAFSSLQYEDGSTQRTSSAAYSSNGSALLLGTAGGSAHFESSESEGNTSSGDSHGIFNFSSSAALIDNGTSTRVNDDYTTSGIARLEFSGSASENSRGTAHTQTHSESEDTNIHSA